MQFSREQLLAITHAERAHLLVSATAGAGKTTVMTERIVRRLLARTLEPAELLVMTFSEKSAAEMKARIEKRVREAADDVLDTTLPEATISTIHAFCNRLVSEFLVDLVDENGEPMLQPGYRVLPADEAKILLNEAIEATLSDLYELASAAEHGELADAHALVPETRTLVSRTVAPFCLAERVDYTTWLQTWLQMAETFAPGFSDQVLTDLLSTLVTTLHSMPAYETWVREQAAVIPDVTYFYADPAVRELRATIERLASPALRELTELMRHPYLDIARDHKAAKTVAQIVAPLERAQAVLPRLMAILAADNANWWDEVAALGQELLPLALPTRRYDTKNGPTQRSFFDLLTPHILPLMHVVGGAIRGKTLLEEFAPNLEYRFVRSVEQQLSDACAMRTLQLRLFETVLLVDGEYRRRKLMYNSVDFSDFEHYALRLLDLPEVAFILQQRYRELYLDEYQDTSSIQDAVIRKLSIARTFMVGDVKQSIYRFRHANPSLFMHKANSYRLVRPDRTASGDGGDLLVLNTNYRSHPGILHAVNTVFDALMQSPEGEIVYDETHRLYAGLDVAKTSPPVTFCLVETTTDDDDTVEEDALELAHPVRLGALDLEALDAVRRIREMLQQGVAAGDIVVLGRNHNICAHYYRMLSVAGMPVQGADNEKLFDTWELSLLESVLTLLTNRRQDIPLVAVMLSVMAADRFDENELLRIRYAFPDVAFHEAVAAYQKVDDALAVKVRAFHAKLDTWRRDAERIGVKALLDSIVWGSGLRDYVSVLVNGPARLKNLDHFLTWIADNEPRDVRHLVGLFEELRRQGMAVKDFAKATTASHAIRVMTMHAAKGLEFPIVFLAGLNQRLNKGRRDKILISEEYGITSDFRDERTGQLFKNPRHTYHLDFLQGREMQEELRLLYVAMTRAKSRLFLMANDTTKEKLAKTVSALLEPERAKIQFVRQQRAHSLARLLLAAWYETDHEVMERWLAGSETERLGEVVFETVNVPAEPGLDDRREEAGREAAERFDPNDPRVARIADLLTPGISDAYLADAPAKQTVSELKRQVDKALRQEPDLTDLPGLDMAFAIERPETRLREEAKAQGTQLHTLFQFLDIKKLRNDRTEAAFFIELNEMVKRERLTPNEAQTMRSFYAATRHYVDSEVADRLLAAGTTVYHEMPFTLSLPLPDAPQEITLVQGMIDLWYEMADGRIGLLDYKSDTIQANDAATLAAEFRRRYQVQLDYYAMAIEKATGKRVTWQEIWSIRDGVLIRLPQRDVTPTGEKR